ncbi:hypothetical protein ACWKWU_20950 [Chitinophaga lutea]
MKVLLCIFAWSLALCSYAGSPVKPVKHFIYFGRDRDKINDSVFYNNPNVSGAQIRYAWRQLEPEKDRYDFSEIEADLRFLASKGKRLFIQIQDATFMKENHAVPEYLRSDTIYHGGEARQCGEISCHGYVARRWDPAVAARFHQLLRKLSEQFDGRIEGINLPETAIDISPKQMPEGFNEEVYVQAIKENMKVVRACFQKSVAILYANFMPGGQKRLKALYDYAAQIQTGMGGPDIKVNKPFQMANSYPLIRAISGKVVTGVAVQDGNYDVVDVKTNRKVTVPEILDFAQNYLQLDYIFWCTEEPYYTREVLPLLTSLSRK